MISILKVFTCWAVILVACLAATPTRINYNLVYHEQSIIDSYEVLQLGSGLFVHFYTTSQRYYEQRKYQLIYLVTNNLGSEIKYREVLVESLDAIYFSPFNYEPNVGVLYSTNQITIEVKILNEQAKRISQTTIKHPLAAIENSFIPTFNLAVYGISTLR